MSNLLSGSGPLKIYRSISVLTTGLIIKANAGGLFYGYVFNNGAAVNYLKIYDKATAPASTDTPVMTIPIGIKAGVALTTTDGLKFTSGISIRASTGVADSDNTAPGANEVIVNFGYL